MDIALRTKHLSRLFSYEKRTAVEDSKLEIMPFQFTQTTGAHEIHHFQKELVTAGFCPVSDNDIQENRTFTYMIISNISVFSCTHRTTRIRVYRR